MSKNNNIYFTLLEKLLDSVIQERKLEDSEDYGDARLDTNTILKDIERVKAEKRA